MPFARVPHRLRYFAADAWDEWRHSPGVNVLALTTLASTLFLAGLLLLVVANLDRQVQAMRADVRVQVFLQDDLAEDERTRLASELAALGGVARVEHVDKQEALRRYRAWASNLAELVNELATNPLPASLEVWLAPGGEAEGTAAAIAVRLKGRPGVEEVHFDRDTIRHLQSLLALARLGGIGLALLVFAVVVFIMASVLRLAVHARRTEIEIMELVGATPGFIRGPFLVAGFGQGLIGALLALFAVEAVRRAALLYAGSDSGALLDLVAAQPLAPSLAGLLVLLGLTVSLAGSYFAVRPSA